MGTTPAPVDRFGRKRSDFSKVSLGAEEIMEWEYVTNKNLQSTINNLQKEGFRIIALEQNPNAVKLATSPKPLVPFALIVGNEVDGVSRNILDMVDEIVEIPMQGRKESLNVAVATGIALFSMLK